ncbi:MAG: hypothetical protein RB191_20645 [Terriglobia bacterium]|nr:hypothetical protein [Terriglobia bacterium]
MATHTISSPQYAISMSGGTGPTATFVAEEYEKSRQKIQESFALGQLAKGSFDALHYVYKECSHTDWDGYGAEPVSSDVFWLAYRFLSALPLGTPAPSIGAEPDGHITLEWYRSPRRTLSVSVSPDGKLHYAALIGPSRQYGTEPFYGTVPDTIIEPIARVEAE